MQRYSHFIAAAGSIDVALLRPQKTPGQDRRQARQVLALRDIALDHRQKPGNRRVNVFSGLRSHHRHGFAIEVERDLSA